MQNNIIPRDKLEKVVSKLSGRIVTTNGAFDLFHVGHLKTLLFAKAQGDILIVGINSDSSIKRYKSEKRPIISQEERAEIVAAIGCVDYVTIFDEETPIELLKIIKPKAHVKGAEYKGKIPEKEIVEKNGGKVVFLERSDASTSSIISRILERYTGE